jgi:dihydrofolate reductase
VNEDVKKIKKNFVKNFWMVGGKEFAKEIARAKLAKVLSSS